MEKKSELNAPPTAPNADKPKEDPELAALKSNFKAAAERQVAVMRDQLELKHLSGKTIVVDDTMMPGNGTLHIVKCDNCKITLAKRTLKVFIQRCTNCEITINAGLFADVMEVWNSDECIFHINVKIATIQLDKNLKITLDFKHKADMSSIVWAGVTNLAIHFADSPADNFVTGLPEMKHELVMRKSFDEIDDSLDQFYVRNIDGKVMKERLVRLPGGMPSTKREIADFDRRHAENEKKIEDAIAKLLQPAARKTSPKPDAKKLAAAQARNAAKETERLEQKEKVSDTEKHEEKGKEKEKEKHHTAATEPPKASPAITPSKPIAAPTATRPAGLATSPGNVLGTSPSGRSKGLATRGDLHSAPPPDDEEEVVCGTRPTVMKSFQYDSVTLHEFEGVNECDGSFLLQSFPSVSFTGIITVGYLVEQLEMPLVGVMSSPLLQPRCVVEHGTPLHGIRLYGNKCLVVAQSEYKLPSLELAHQIVRALVDFSKRHKLHMLVGVEGIPSESPSDYEKKVQYITTNRDFGLGMKKLGYTCVKSGVIAGFTGLLLAEAPLHGLDVGCVLAPTHTQYPDARSAVAVINALTGHFECLYGLDTSKLESKAKLLEKTVSELLQEQKPEGAPPGMYQ